MDQKYAYFIVFNNNICQLSKVGPRAAGIRECDLTRFRSNAVWELTV